MFISTAKFEHGTSINITFANDEPSLHGGDGEGELLQASRGAHVPVALAATSAPTTGSWGTSSLHTPQQVGYDLCRMLRPVRGPHNLCYPLWCSAII